MFQRIKNFFYQRKVDKVVKQAVKETKFENIEPALKTKRCPRCWIVKAQSDFYRNRSKHDWLQTECKDCRLEMSRKKQETPQFIPYRKEFYWWWLNVMGNSIRYERNGSEFIIIDRIRYQNLCKQYWKDMVRDKISHMIRYQNKNNLWKKDEDLYYRLRNRCQKQQIQDKEKQGLFS